MNIKKYLPLILLLVGIAVVAGAFLFLRSRGNKELIEEEEIALLDVPLNERPVVSLTPTDDGHYLVLGIDKIVIDAESLDYELLYQTEAGVTQGVPGTVSLQGRDSYEAELLLGSESSGKFRYDEGVEEGSITIRFRNRDGKLLAKFTSDFHLQTDESTLSSQDNVFTAEVDDSDLFFVTMQTIGIPSDAPGELVSGPYGVFSSSDLAIEGNVSLNGTAQRWDGEEWAEDFDEATGIFIGI